jgi:tRNA (guanine-N7-)-methyltransferase
VAPGAPLEIEVGFGRGAFLVERARRNPDTRFLGFEVKTTLVAALSARLARLGITNVRLALCDARPVVDRWVAAGRLQMVHVLFPDPWWKKRHHGRRVMSPEFVRAVHARLADGGAIHFRTDVWDYADEVAEVVRAHGGFVEDDAGGPELPETDRERRCEEFGLPVRRHRFTRRPDSTPEGNPW